MYKPRMVHIRTYHPPLHFIAPTTIPVSSPVLFIPSLYYTSYNSKIFFIYYTLTTCLTCTFKVFCEYTAVLSLIEQPTSLRRVQDQFSRARSAVHLGVGPVLVTPIASQVSPSATSSTNIHIEKKFTRDLIVQQEIIAKHVEAHFMSKPIVRHSETSSSHR